MWRLIVAALVEDPPRHRRVQVLQAAQDAGDGDAVDLQLGAAAGQVAQGSVNADRAMGSGCYDRVGVS